MHRRRAGGAGIFHPRRAFKAQIGRGLEHQRGGEILRREAGIEMAQHDFIDVFRRNAGIGQSIAGNTHDQAFDGLAAQFAEVAMRPADDARGHGISTLVSAVSWACRILVAFTALGSFRPITH